MLQIFTLALLVLVRATDELKSATPTSASESGGHNVKLSGHVVALIVCTMALSFVAFVYICQQRRRVNKILKKKQEEEERVKWFEKQVEQMKTPTKKSSVINLTCTAIPVATFRGSTSTMQQNKLRDLPAKLPIVNFDSSCCSVGSLAELPDDTTLCEVESALVSQKVHIRQLYLPNSDVPIALEIVESQNELTVESVSVDMEDSKATLEYVTKSNL